MKQSVKDILRTGDICEIKDMIGKFEVGENFSIYIEGKLYEFSSTGEIHKVENYEEKITRVLRPTMIEKSLDMWRYAKADTWRYYVSSFSNRDAFKTIYVQNKALGLNIQVLKNKNELTYEDDKVIDCVKNMLRLNPNLNLRLLWELLNTTVHPLLNTAKHALAYTGTCICVTRMFDSEYIAEITETNYEEENK